MIRKDEPTSQPPSTPEPAVAAAPQAPSQVAPRGQVAAPARTTVQNDDELFDLGSMEGLTMADLLGPDPSQKRAAKAAVAGEPSTKPAARSVDDFDFDEEAFLAALDDHEPHGTT